MGLLGEETNTESNLVWITKTHYPLDSLPKGVFRAKKMIKIVRNPLDVIVSYCNGMWTFTHSLAPVEKYDVVVPEMWDSAIKYFSEDMAADFERVINAPNAISK